MIRNIKKRYWFAKQLCHHKWIFFSLLFTWINYRVQQSLTINCTFIIILTNFFFQLLQNQYNLIWLKEKENTSQMQISLQKSSNLYIYPYLRMKQKKYWFLFNHRSKMLILQLIWVFISLSWNYHCIKSFLWTLSMCIMDYLSFQLNNSRYW